MTAVDQRKSPSPPGVGDPGTPWLLVILCVLVPVLPTIAVLPGPLRGHGSPARLIGYACFGIILLGFALNQARRKRPGGLNAGAAILAIYFFLLLLTFGMGALYLGNDVIESSKIRTLLILVADVGVALYTIKYVRTERQRAIVLGSLSIGLAYACFVGLFQSFLNIDLRFALVPPGFVTVLDVAGLAGRQGALRAMGTSDHAIEFSVLAAIAIPLALHLARYASTSLRRQLAGIACVLALLAVPTAVSRTGVVVLGASMAVYAFSMSVRAIGNAVMIGMAVVLAYKIASPGAINALWTTIATSHQDASITTRTDDYAAVGEQFRADPLFGLGLGAYPPTEYRFLDNQWLQAIVQGGTVGLVAMCLFVVGGVCGATTSFRNSRSERERNQVYAITAAFAGLVASSFTFDLFSFQQATFLLFIVFGLLWTVRSTSDRVGPGAP